jgi:hypothetical protein
MSTIHQINANYHAVQDRVLLRIATLQNEEFELWLTRRIAVQLVDALSTLTRSAPYIEQPRSSDVSDVAGAATTRGSAEDPVRTAVPSGARGAAMQPPGRGRFAQPYEERPRIRPLGDEPVLIRGGELKLSGDLIQVKFLVVDERALTMSLARDEASAALSLLLQAGARAEWRLLETVSPGFDTGSADKDAYH